MSTLRVEVTTIDDVLEHGNAERLSVALIGGWNCVVQKGAFKPGDACVYIPIDSMIPPELETKIFGSDSKIKLTNGRIKTIKLRGVISQGLVVSLKTLGFVDDGFKVGTDLTEILGVKKYEPPAPPFDGFKGGKKSQRLTNPEFHKYTDIENMKNYKNVFSPNDSVVITEKCHGSSWRTSWSKRVPRNFFERILKRLGWLPEYEFLVGSHNTERDANDDNIYSKIARDQDIKNLLQKGETLYGEIYGPSIQKGYGYGLMPGHVDLVVFDIKKDGKYLDYPDFVRRCHQMGLRTVPLLFRGYLKNADLKKLVSGPSMLSPAQDVREGVVIKPLYEENCRIGRKILKFINDEYLLNKEESSYH